jgi:sugar-specific transcriptional regulator TrmB
MTPNTDDESVEQAIDRLERLGLSAYAARTFVALVDLGDGTAKDVSETVDVPRTRVYDAAEELSDRGLVEIESATPRRFRAVPIERAVLVLGTEYADRIDEVTAALASVAGTESSLARDDLWRTTDDESIRERQRAIVADADRTLLFATDGPVPSEQLLAELREAARRDLSVRLVGLSADETADLDTGGIEVDHGEPPWDPDHVSISTVLVADDDAAIVTAGDRRAFWSDGESNTLLLFLRAVLDIE